MLDSRFLKPTAKDQRRYYFRSDFKIREPLIKVYFHHSCVGTTFGNLVNLKHIHDFPKVAPPCYDANILLIRASLACSYQIKLSIQRHDCIVREGGLSGH
jgi:hypothetical protein